MYKRQPYDYLGELSFDATVYDDNNANNDGSYNASTNYWESGASGMANSISQIECGSNTNTTAALYKAYHDIITAVSYTHLDVYKRQPERYSRSGHAIRAIDWYIAAVRATAACLGRVRQPTGV